VTHNASTNFIRASAPYITDLKLTVLSRIQNSTDDKDISTQGNTTVSILGTTNKGPLLTIALALFGESSFLATKTSHPVASNYSEKYVGCTELMPLSGLIPDPLPGSTCITSAEGTFMSLTKWLAAFSAVANMKEAVTGAVFLANKAWLISDPDISGQLLVQYDLGQDTSRPSVSLVGLVAISILLGIFITSLMALSIYASITPTWTDSLDAFAMLRIGASQSKHFPLWIGRHGSKIDTLDSVSGWIGDTSGPDDEFGTLAVGTGSALDPRIRYRCYPPDHEPISYAEWLEWLRKRNGASREGQMLLE
jgi:hypothetical protein